MIKSDKKLKIIKKGVTENMCNTEKFFLITDDKLCNFYFLQLM